MSPLFLACVALIAAASTTFAQQPTPAPSSNLANISTRMRVETGDNVLIAGFIINGTAPKKVMLRAIGPGLSNAGIADALPDPTLELFQGTTQLATNDNWKDAPERAEIEASTIPPGNDLESAIVRTLAPGAYTAVMRGKGDTTGVGLIELYDLDPGADSKLANISTRGLVQTGENVMIAGIIVVGDSGAPQRVLVRASGPSLPVSGKLANPTLELVNANGTALRSNDNWKSDQEAPIRASTIPPANELEAAVVETLTPGNYTAIVRDAGNSSGVGLVEVYALNNDYRGAWPLAGYDPGIATTSDLEPVRWLIGDATVAAFGESYHTSGGFYLMKHRLLRFLVEKLGFRAFAIESNWEGAELAENYVWTGTGTPEQAISRHINVWQGTEYADLVRWIREWNAAHPALADKVTLFGFDIQQPWDDAPGLRGYLQQIGIPQSDPRSTGLSQCEQVDGNYSPFGQIPPERHQACLDTLSAIENHFTKNKSSLIGHTSQQEFDIAMLRVVGLRAWENSVFIIAHDRPTGYSARDQGMAYAFQVMRAMKAPNARTMVWAANSHVARAPLSTGEVPFGSYLAKAFGEKYASFAQFAFTAEIDYPGFGCGPVQRSPDSIEDALAPELTRQNSPAMLIDARGGSVLEPRVYASGDDRLTPHLHYDGIIYLALSPQFHPLLWPPCR